MQFCLSLSWFTIKCFSKKSQKHLGFCLTDAFSSNQIEKSFLPEKSLIKASLKDPARLPRGRLCPRPRLCTGSAQGTFYLNCHRNLAPLLQVAALPLKSTFCYILAFPQKPSPCRLVPGSLRPSVPLPLAGPLQAMLKHCFACPGLCHTCEPS